MMRSKETLEGECLRCGLCCRINGDCPHLRVDGGGIAVCNVYERRPMGCKYWPTKADFERLRKEGFGWIIEKCGYRSEAQE